MGPCPAPGCSPQNRAAAASPPVQTTLGAGYWEGAATRELARRGGAGWEGMTSGLAGRRLVSRGALAVDGEQVGWEGAAR